MDQYIQNAKNIFHKEIVDIPQFIYDCSENLDKDGYYKSDFQISTIQSPLYYFFDKYFNKNITSNGQSQDCFLHKTKISDMVGFNKSDKIIDIFYRKHRNKTH